MLQPAVLQSYQQVRDAVKVPDNHQTSPIFKFVVEMLSTAAEAAHVPGVGPALGVVNSIMKFTNEMAESANGEDLEALSTTAERLGQVTADSFAAALTTQSQTFGYLYANWGKLSAVADGLTHDAPAWDVSADDAGQYVTASSAAIKLGYYRALIPAAYQRFEAQAAPTAALENWCLSDNGMFCFYAGGGGSRITPSPTRRARTRSPGTLRRSTSGRLTTTF